MNKSLLYLKGYLTVRISDGCPERFLSLCGSKNIFLWEICRKESGFEFCIFRKDFYRLRSIARKTRVKVVILRRQGLPFFFSYLCRRWIFFAGLSLVVCFLWLSTCFLWKINIYGNCQITSDQLLEVLKREKIIIGCNWKDVSISDLEKEIRKEYPVVNWVSARREGSVLEICLKENSVIPLNPGKNSPGEDMICVYPSLVSSVIVRSGVSKVKAGDLVKPGTVLVEGKVPVYNEDGTVREELPVTADADIRLEYSVLYECALEEYYVKKQYTGRTKKRLSVYRNGQRFLLDGRKNFCLQDILTEDAGWDISAISDNEKIPLLRLAECCEYQNILMKYSEEEAKTLFDQKISRFLAFLEEKGVQIIEKNVRIDKEGECWICYCDLRISDLAGNRIQ